LYVSDKSFVKCVQLFLADEDSVRQGLVRKVEVKRITVVTFAMEVAMVLAHSGRDMLSSIL